ncbi:hypothetical protein CDV36_000584 [Fusarium kuroshium]|uniref:Nephrocystin 3-like N-terminal domain-containing protein n=1 Tax=Fusarium kuroshium TaxID=2010991 RepID=A0A3M2SQE5_9HYPO|nr:hypothetical protein CDV36_000584 [Fusarium kuroshium]
MSAEASANNIAVTIRDVNLGPGATAILGMNNVGSDIKAQGETLRRCKNDLFVSEPRSVRTELLNTKGSLTEGTCQWILHNETYRSWLEAQDSGLLWISGGPGRGKTMLSIFLTQEWESLPDCVFYVFCGDKATSDEVTIMRSLLYQVLSQVPSMVDHVGDCLGTGERTKHTLSSRGDLWAIFTSMLKDPRLGPVLGLVDGLDECNRDSTRWLLNNLRHVFDKRSRSRLLPSSPFRLAIVSRDMIGLRSYPRLNLETKTDVIAEDVARVIDAGMKEHDLFSELDDEFITEVKKTLRRRSDGTFLWVGFAIQELLSVETMTEMRFVLDAIPRDLGALYSKILLRIKGPMKEKIIQLLHWVTLACHPLTASELADALGMDAHTIVDLVAMSGSLLTLSRQLIREQQNPWKPIHRTVWSKKMVVKLVHASVSDFLKGDANEDILPAPDFRIHVEEMELQITQRCLSEIEALFCRPLAQGGISWNRFSEYAACFWHQHARHCGERLERLLDSDIAFFQSESGGLLRSRWWNGYKRLIRSGFYHQIGSTGLSLLHICSGLGLLPLVKRLLRDMDLAGNQVDDPDSGGWTALCYALVCRHAVVAQLLVDHAASLTRDIKEQTRYGETRSFKPIHKAMELGAEVAEPFLKRALESITPNPPPPWPSSRNTALERSLFLKAASLGDEQLVHIMFSNGATLDSHTALLALERALRQDRSLAFMELMLQHCPSTFDLDPLVVFKGHPGVFYSRLKTLLGHGMNPNSGSGKYALLHDVVLFPLDFVELLLDSGAHINALDHRGQTAIFYALEDSRIDLTAVLLNRGADLTIRDSYGNTALHWAIKNRNSNGVEMLLKSGGDVNDRDGSGRTALACALSLGHFSIAEVLLKHGAYVDAGDEDCGRGGDSYREPGEDVRGKDILKQPDLFLGAVRDRSVQVVRLFLRHGAEVNLHVGSITPLKTAISNRHVDMQMWPTFAHFILVLCRTLLLNQLDSKPLAQSLYPLLLTLALLHDPRLPSKILLDEIVHKHPLSEYLLLMILRGLSILAIGSHSSQELGDAHRGHGRAVQASRREATDYVKV